MSGVPIPALARPVGWQARVAPSAIVVTSTTPLWYLTRATGLVALVLLTLNMACGLLTSVRCQRQAWPRFVTIGLHRNIALLALAFTVLHIITTLADSFVPIKVQDVFIPFISAYRPLWLSLGAIAFDLMLALAITSLLRTRMSYWSWRLVHWSAYLCWPVAVLHGLGAGIDTPMWRWVFGADAVALVVSALMAALAGWRLAYGVAVGARGRPAGRRARPGAFAHRGRRVVDRGAAAAGLVRAGRHPDAPGQRGRQNRGHPMSAAGAMRSAGTAPRCSRRRGCPGSSRPAGRCRSRTTSTGTARCRSATPGSGPPT